MNLANKILQAPAWRSLPIWLPDYLRRPPRPDAAHPTDIMFCICDHFEPLHATDRAGAGRRLLKWRKHYPEIAAGFRDADGRPPRHSFFYPAEQYDPELLKELAAMQQAGMGEVEIHLHHENDDEASLRKKLLKAVENFHAHDLLCHDRRGRPRYGFIHGNWALDNSDPAGRHCGVNTELNILLDTGCYADFTMPSAPHPTQTRIINSLYYARDTPAPKSHDRGRPVQVRKYAAATPRAELLMVQGPLALNWGRRKFGLLPRIENGALTGRNPPSALRLRLWLEQAIHVRGRPEWLFIKLHTHGCDEAGGNTAMLLGEPMRRFHRILTTSCNDGRSFRLHYVTARELVNIIHAAEDGLTGDPGACRNYRYRHNLDI